MIKNLKKSLHVFENSTSMKSFHSWNLFDGMTHLRYQQPTSTFYYQSNRFENKHVLNCIKKTQYLNVLYWENQQSRCEMNESLILCIVIKRYKSWKKVQFNDLKDLHLWELIFSWNWKKQHLYILFNEKIWYIRYVTQFMVSCPDSYKGSHWEIL